MNTAAYRRGTAALALGALALTGCQTLNTNKERGVLIGAATGAVAGGAIGRANGSTAKGAILGAVVGGTIGGVIGHQMDQQAKELEQNIPGAVVDLTTHAGLIETSLSLRDRHTWFGRAELVGKPGHDLHMHATPATIYTIGKIQGGYVRSFHHWNGLVLGVGGTGSVSLVPPALVPRYPSRTNPGFGVFASMRPARHG